MSGRDGTGPIGMGPLSGRGLGYCNSMDGNNYRYGAGYYGLGGGQRGYRRQYYRTGLPGSVRSGDSPGMARMDETAYLQGRRVFLEGQLKQINARINEITETDH